MNKCHSWESFLRKTNLQHAMHNFYWYIIEFYFTSDPFSFEQSTKCSGKNIYAVGIEIVKLVWALHWNIFIFFSFFSALRFSFSPTVGFCVVPTESGRQQHRKIFSVRIWMYCEYIYWNKRILKLNSTKRYELCRRRMEKQLLHNPHRFLDAACVCLCSSCFWEAPEAVEV